MGNHGDTFDGPQLQRTVYTKADLEGAHFDGINLDGTLRDAARLNVCGAAPQ